MSKIFGIGLSRTGTTSLTHALQCIGIDIIHYPTKQQLFDAKNRGACDIPVVRFYKELDKMFPSSKFIYTIREKNEWLESIEAHLTRRKAANEHQWGLSNRLAVYHQTGFDKESFSKIYDEHDRDVRKYFENRKQDVLIIDVCAGQGWDKLLPFLEITKAPKVPFPHTNKRRPK